MAAEEKGSLVGYLEDWARQISSSTVLSCGDEEEKAVDIYSYPSTISTAVPSSDMPFMKQISSSSMATTCRSMLSMSHVERWAEPDETLIIFDWDDTLCPTSDMKETDEGHGGFERAELETHQAAVVCLLQAAAEIGKVRIVTMADITWIRMCIAELMPGLKNILDELQIPIVEARAARTPRLTREANADAREPSHFYKTKAMQKVVSDFYGAKTPCQRSWKNILSIGDSECEKYAVQDVVFRHSQKDHAGHEKRCRCKAVKMLERPDLLFLTGQLQAIISWLAKIAYYDGDMDIDLDDLLEPNSPTSPLKSFCQPPPDLALS
mmetsp:Transcript_153694/g.272574  ORF Transcript_153694/g.272574 Transcript_153694/m.272574 type:complete len:323 (-) Transcript_153694:201-1169(-)